MENNTPPGRPPGFVIEERLDEGFQLTLPAHTVRLLNDIGVCAQCLHVFSHYIDEPFSACDCFQGGEYAFSDITRQPLLIQLQFLRAQFIREKLIKRGPSARRFDLVESELQLSNGSVIKLRIRVWVEDPVANAKFIWLSADGELSLGVRVDASDSEIVREVFQNAVALTSDVLTAAELYDKLYHAVKNCIRNYVINKQEEDLIR